MSTTPHDTWHALLCLVEDEFFRTLDTLDRNRVRFGWTY